MFQPNFWKTRGCDYHISQASMFCHFLNNNFKQNWHLPRILVILSLRKVTLQLKLQSYSGPKQRFFQLSRLSTPKAPRNWLQPSRQQMPSYMAKSVLGSPLHPTWGAEERSTCALRRPPKMVGPLWSTLSAVWCGLGAASAHTPDVPVWTGTWDAVRSHPWTALNTTSDLNFCLPFHIWSYFAVLKYLLESRYPGTLKNLRLLICIP